MIKIWIKNLFLFPFLLLQSCFSRFSGEVDKEVSNSYYYAKGTGDIVYSPMGNWFELGYDKMDADKATFRPIARDFGKDKDHVYYKYEKLPFVDHASFIIENNVIKDINKVYAERDREIKVVEEADPKSYHYLALDSPYSQKWAKDDSHYFLYDLKLAVDYESFRILKNELVVDKNFIYTVEYEENKDFIWGKPFLQKIDSVKGDIREINTVYSRMGNTIYGLNDRSGYQKHTFDKIRDIEIIDENCIIVNDNLLIKGEKFPYEAVDLATFEKLGDVSSTSYYRDKNHVYCEGEVITGADLASFQLLDWGYTKDKNSVYYHGSIVEGAKPASFRFDKKRSEWRDEKYFYSFGKAVKK